MHPRRVRSLNSEIDRGLFRTLAFSCRRSAWPRVGRGEWLDQIELCAGVDVRTLLDDPSIDAISIASLDPWHALHTIWSCQAGKDVDCEKPVSHNVLESRRMIQAARKYERMVQVGTQCRSSPNIRKAVEKPREGVIGRVYMARSIAYKVRAGGKNAFERMPQGLDWNLRQGPAPKTPYNAMAISRWRFMKQYGNGQAADQGVHRMDIARWGLGIDRHLSTTLPLSANISFWTKQSLKFDPSAEQIVDAENAGNCLTRDYRSPFVVPEQV